MGARGPGCRLPALGAGSAAAAAGLRGLRVTPLPLLELRLSCLRAALALDCPESLSTQPG
jgi:hypothetical protein